MKNLNVNFAQRLSLGNFLALATGPLGKMASLQRVYEAVRFSDADMRQIKVTDLGNGMSTFQPPSPEFGTLEVQVEDADATILHQEIDSCQQFRIADLGWVNSIKEQLAAPSVAGKKRNGK